MSIHSNYKPKFAALLCLSWNSSDLQQAILESCKCWKFLASCWPAISMYHVQFLKSLRVGIMYIHYFVKDPCTRVLWRSDGGRQRPWYNLTSEIISIKEREEGISRDIRKHLLSFTTVQISVNPYYQPKYTWVTFTQKFCYEKQ